MKNLLIIRGAPGAGKTTIAKALLAAGLYDCHFEADMYFTGIDGVYKWIATQVHLAHEWCLEQVAVAMSEGRSIIVSNTFVRHQDVTPYLQIADYYKYKTQEMILWNAPFENVHGVPEDKVFQKLTRLHNEFS